jgi:hypothetical protein
MTENLRPYRWKIADPAPPEPLCRGRDGRTFSGGNTTVVNTTKNDTPFQMIKMMSFNVAEK